MRNFIFYNKGEEIPPKIKNNLIFIERKKITADGEGYKVYPDWKTDEEEDYKRKVGETAEKLGADVVIEAEYERIIGPLKRKEKGIIFTTYIHEVSAVAVDEFYKLRKNEED